MRGLKQYTQRIVLSVLFQVRQANSDGREHNRYRNTILRFFDEKSQDVTTYLWTRPCILILFASFHTFVVF